MNKYLLGFFAFICFLLPHSAHATTYYVDFSAAGGGNGLATTTPFNNLNAFTDVARAPGDFAIVRRGQASTTGIVAATFTSDGTLNNPITVTADYWNLWNYDSTSTQTYTPVFGTTTMASSASTTGITIGDWVYVDGDCNDGTFSTTTQSCLFAYEVKQVTTTYLETYLPYKGNQGGAGKSLRRMPANPQIGTASEATQIMNISSDNYWIIKGLDLRSTNSGCVVVVGAVPQIVFSDMIFIGNGAADCGLNTNAASITYLNKVRVFNVFQAVAASIANLIVKDFFFDCNSVATSHGISSNISATFYAFTATNGRVTRCTNLYSPLQVNTIVFGAFNNVRGNDTYTAMNGTYTQRISFEDRNGTPGLNSQISNQAFSNILATTTISTTTNIRSGGGPLSEYILPPAGAFTNTGISTTDFPLSFIKLFEYPVYTSAASTTFSMYFATASSSAFTANPTASEFWIECEAYGDATELDGDRKLVQSTSTLNFTGSTSYQALSVQCKPTVAGIVYIRGWYGKPKEAVSNQFYMDTTPVITSP